MWIHLLALELIDGASAVDAPVVVETAAPTAGVRRARFLRRAPKLPWEIEDEPEQQVTVSPPRRKRIPLPAVQAMRSAVGDAIPIQTVKEIAAPVISIPDVGRAAVTIADEDEDDWLWLI